MESPNLLQLLVGGGIITGLAGMFFMAGKLVSTIEQLTKSVTKIESQIGRLEVRVGKVEDKLGNVEKELKDVQTKVTVLWEQRTGA